MWLPNSGEYRVVAGPRLAPGGPALNSRHRLVEHAEEGGRSAGISGDGLGRPLSTWRPRVGRVRPPIDALLAATAICHPLKLAMRNVADFEGTGVVMVNPRVATTR